MSGIDVIDKLVGTSLKWRMRRPITVEQTQKSYEALFLTNEDAGFALKERFAVAAFVARLHGYAEAISFYDDELRRRQPEWLEIIAKAANSAKSTGPFGLYPAGPLEKENTIGKGWIAGKELKDCVGQKLAAALTHAHRLVFHPRDCQKTDLDALLAVGWTNKTLVTLSQLVAFLCFQIRLADGLNVLAASQHSD